MVSCYMGILLKLLYNPLKLFLKYIIYIHMHVYIHTYTEQETERMREAKAKK